MEQEEDSGLFEVVYSYDERNFNVDIVEADSEEALRKAITDSFNEAAKDNHAISNLQIKSVTRIFNQPTFH